MDCVSSLEDDEWGWPGRVSLLSRGGWLASVLGPGVDGGVLAIAGEIVDT